MYVCMPVLVYMDICLLSVGCSTLISNRMLICNVGSKIKHPTTVNIICRLNILLHLFSTDLQYSIWNIIFEEFIAKKLTYHTHIYQADCACVEAKLEAANSSLSLKSSVLLVATALEHLCNFRFQIYSLFALLLRKWLT